MGVTALVVCGLNVVPRKGPTNVLLVSCETNDYGWPETHYVAPDRAPWPGRPAALWHKRQLAANVLTGLLIVLAVGSLWEARRRIRGATWQLSLREALVALLLVSLVLGAWAAACRRMDREQAIAAELTAQGLGVLSSARTPAWLWGILRNQEGETFSIPNYASVYARPQFASSDEPPRITDDTLRRVGELRGLVELDLSGGLRSGGPYADVRITDAGIAHLGGLSHLQQLHLDHAQVSDASIEMLARLRNLRWISLVGTQVTPRGVARLQEAIPGIVIVGP